MIKLLHVGITAREGRWLSKALARSTNYAEIEPQDGPNKIINLFNSHKPDIVFMQIQHDRPELLPVVQVMNKKAVVINCCGDVREPMPEWYKTFSKHCITAFSNMEDVNEIGGEYLQIGIDPQIFNRDKLVVKSRDIVFMANRSMCFPLSEYRVKTVDFLKRIYKEKFELYGSWPMANGNFNHDQYGENRIYNEAKIGISISHFDRHRYFSDRLPRIMGSGCFALSHHYKDIEKDFEVGQHLDTFKDHAELQRKIDYYLQNPDERQAIALNGWKHVQENFTTQNMVNDIFRIYEAKHKPTDQLV